MRAGGQKPAGIARACAVLILVFAHFALQLDIRLSQQPRSLPLLQQLQVDVQHRSLVAQQLNDLIHIQPSMQRLRIQSVMPALNIMLEPRRRLNPVAVDVLRMLLQQCIIASIRLQLLDCVDDSVRG